MLILISVNIVKFKIVWHRPNLELLFFLQVVQFISDSKTCTKLPVIDEWC